MNGGNEFMATLPNCPKCNSEYTYEDGTFLFVQNVPMNGQNRSKLLKKML